MIGFSFDPDSSNNTSLFLYVSPFKISTLFVLFNFVSCVPFTYCWRPGGRHTGAGGPSGTGGSLGGLGCLEGLLLPPVSLRWKESILLQKKISGSHPCSCCLSKAFTALLTASFRIFSIFSNAEYFLLEIININFEILLKKNLCSSMMAVYDSS